MGFYFLLFQIKFCDRFPVDDALKGGHPGSPSEGAPAAAVDVEDGADVVVAGEPRSERPNDEWVSGALEDGVFGDFPPELLGHTLW